jgi:hypothetical protein
MSVTVRANRKIEDVDSPSAYRLWEARQWWEAWRERGLSIRFMSPDEVAAVEEVEVEQRAMMGRLRLPALER